MDNTAALDPLLRHFGGAKEHFSALVAHRQMLHGLPVIRLDGTAQADIQSRLPSETAGVFLALFDDAGSIALRQASGQQQPTGQATSLAALPMVPSAACETLLPEVVAYRIATGLCEVVWGIHPIAIFVDSTGAGSLLYAAFTPNFLHGVNHVSTMHVASSDSRLGAVLGSALRRQEERPAEEEVKEPLRRPIRRWLHQHVVKHCLSSRRQLAAHITQQCKNANSVIDVSAGDDTVALRLVNSGLDLVVANDIAFADMQRMGAPRSGRSPANLILSSRPVEHLEFDRRFDVAVLKNTLHHFTSAAEVSASLKAMGNLANRLVFVEIEDPTLTFRGRAWNLYYERLLGDGGDDHRFYNMHAFRQVLRRHFLSADATFGCIPTGRGNYLVATIDLPKQ